MPADKFLLLGIVGCTGTGKTALGAAVCRELGRFREGGEVVSCDSMQVYAGMPIATAQPDEDERCGVPHHLIGFLPPDEKYSVARFCNDARAVIADITARGKVPVVVGGTGLYYSALTQNLHFSPEESDAETRVQLRAEAEADGGASLLEKLRAVDPIAAERLQTGGIGRIVRAWERYLATGLTPGEHDALSRAEKSPYRSLTIGLDCRDREKLYARLDSRTEQMLRNGLWEEAERFLENCSPTARQAIGHKELAPALRGEISRDQAVDNLKRATRQYAKRQRTWFLNKTSDVRWLYTDDYARAEDLHSAAMDILRACG
ncbi:MAG: tRNA (adenosine(37)-N6)-dimethylallyltransferase MiaA [Oscillospiraceae bacterium]|jgi:tRNA dimethylallyltransferase|nr:tRNA (adenosine(37)-N6)-dimethylallyltransferase MiaA [Oscillospiraceae bacterium]